MKSLISAFLLCAVAAFGYERLQGPTELLFSDKEKAFNGYTLFGVGSRTYLLDMGGRVVHTWPVGTNPRLLDNGNVLDATKDDPSGFQGFQEVDWDGRTVWEYTEKREGYAPHHDWVRIFNKALNAPTTLYIANKSITNDQAIAAGADPRKGPYREGQMDAIVEEDMQGKVVWEWWFFDHIVQDIDPEKPNHVGPGKTIADHPGRINLNMPGKPLKRDWLHCNSLDSNTEGHFFEVTSDNKLAWEYINPITRDGAMKVLGDALPMTNSAFRAFRYGADHPAFKGRELTPQGTITDRAAQGLDVQPKRRPPSDRPPGGGDRQGRRGQGGGQGKGGNGEKRGGGQNDPNQANDASRPPQEKRDGERKEDK